MLELIDISKRFEENTVLKAINLTVDKGRKATIIGPSGSGKSTILRLILCLIQPDRGQLLLDNMDITKASKKELYEIRNKIGLLFQSAALFDSMTVEENISFSLTERPHRLTQKEISRKVNHALELVEMSGQNKKQVTDLSGGQKKRIGLARVIINDPEYLLFDEPTTGLDPVLSTNIENLIVNISKELNAATLTVTHQISTILRTSDDIYFLHDGQLLDPESPNTIYQSKSSIIKNFMNGKSSV
ncbi:ABC transporter ATP-binding protein [Candidatus Marinamargulisbacteria bacterium SCGC AG-343-D04]|nr:ABC transporter ATP-binding protein [Candidatus Marinamargulisbacteria bacterium SCGC AG-343-D04]